MPATRNGARVCSSTILSESREHRRNDSDVCRPRGPVRAKRKAEERKRFDHRVDPDRGHIRLRAQPRLVESQSVVLNPNGPTGERIPDTLDRRFHLLVDLHQPMMQPLDRSWTCRIERSMSHLAVFIDREISQRRRQCPRVPVTARRLRSCGECIH